MTPGEQSLLIAERALLIAVRNRLRLPEDDGGAGYDTRECEIEFAEMVPATVGKVYVSVMTGGWAPGPRHRVPGGVWDFTYSVEVSIIKRVTHVPRDRQRDVFLTNIGSLTQEIGKIMRALDYRYEVTQAANATMLAETGCDEGFHHPLVFAGMDKQPRIVGGDVFADMPQESKAGLARTIMFNSARRTVSR